MTKSASTRCPIRMQDTSVGVWNYERQRFIGFIPCPGEKRVRIDAHDALSNYAVFAGEWKGNVFYPIGCGGESLKPLRGWKIDLS